MFEGYTDWNEYDRSEAAKKKLEMIIAKQESELKAARLIIEAAKEAAQWQWQEDQPVSNNALSVMFVIEGLRLSLKELDEVTK